MLSIIIAILMIVSVVPTAFAAETETVIIYTNDVHCAIDNYPVIAAYKAELVAQGKNVLVVDAGDAIQGEIIGAITQGEAVVDIMNEIGYDYAIPGNHEFDYGMEVFLDLAKNKAEYEYISSNFHYLPKAKPVFAPYVIIEAEGAKIAFLGISTPKTITTSTPTYFQNEAGEYIYGFCQGEEGAEELELDLAAVMTWYRYGNEPKTITCGPSKAVAKTLNTAQLKNNELKYRFDLTGADARYVEITSVSLAAGDSAYREVADNGSVTIELPGGNGDRKYTFQAANNVPIAMLKVAAFYLVFTPLSTWLGHLAEGIGAHDFLILAVTMIANFVLEFLYYKFVVFKK